MTENPWELMRRALADADNTIRAANRMSTECAKVHSGRLRHVKDADVLRDLKRELRDFDMTTGKWKQK
ncbi:MAG: hypothetical protein AB7L90_25850 [Hyphomicrobiaceae bacterium]